MATIRARKKADGSVSYTVQIRLKNKGAIVYQECQTFARKQAALAWARKREAELDEPGAIERANRKGTTVKEMIDRYLAEMEKVRPLGKTKLATLKAISESYLGKLNDQDINSQQLVEYALWRMGKEGGNVQPQTAGNDLAHLGAVLSIARPAWGYEVDPHAMTDVVGVADAPAGAGICDDFRPRFAVDIEVLGPDGEPDPELPPLAGVPLSMPMGGDEMGFFAFPEEGTTVVVCFAYGLPHKPYIQTILPHGLSLPKVPKGDQVWQHSEAAQQRVDADGNWLRQTDGKIQDKAIEREVEALDNTESFQNHTRTVDDHSTESVGGIKKIEALGALKLLSGGSASLAAVDDLHQATGRDLNVVVGQKHNATVGGDMQEKIQGLRKSVAGLSQHLVAPKNHIGSESVNIFQVLCNVIDLVQAMNTQLAAHTHVPGPAPSPADAAAFVAKAQIASSLSIKLNSVTA